MLFYLLGFKPYYKWITFNIIIRTIIGDVAYVLNLIINGLPSISLSLLSFIASFRSFKPYYKWITFNILLTEKIDTNILAF